MAGRVLQCGREFLWMAYQLWSIENPLLTTLILIRKFVNWSALCRLIDEDVLKQSFSFFLFVLINKIKCFTYIVFIIIINYK